MEEKRVVILNKYEYGLIINALNELRTKLIRENKSTEIVNELLNEREEAVRIAQKENSISKRKGK